MALPQKYTLKIFRKYWVELAHLDNHRQLHPNKQIKHIDFTTPHTSALSRTIKTANILTDSAKIMHHIYRNKFSILHYQSKFHNKSSFFFYWLETLVAHAQKKNSLKTNICSVCVYPLLEINWIYRLLSSNRVQTCLLVRVVQCRPTGKPTLAIIKTEMTKPRT